MINITNLINIINHTEIDKQKWDLAVLTSANPEAFALTNYLDAITPQWEGIVYGDYEAVLPLPYKYQFRIKYIFNPLFWRYCNAYAKNQEIRQVLIDHFHHYVTTKIKYTHINVAWQLNQDHYEKMLFQTVDKQQLKYNNNTKRNIQKAIQHNLSLVEIDTPTTHDFFRTHKGPDLEKLWLKTSYYPILERLMLYIDQHNFSLKYGVVDNNEVLVAVAYFITFGNYFYYLIGASSPEGKQSGAMHFLFDTVIQKHTSSNTLIDFGGSNVPSVAQFYKGFGGIDQPYYVFHHNQLPFFIKWLKN